MINHKLFLAVTNDVQHAVEQARKDDNQYNRRSYVRASFAAIEAYTYMLKSFAIDEHNKEKVKYSVAELSMLREENYGINNKGEAYSYPRFVSPADNFRFAIEKAMRWVVNDYKLNISGRGWDNLKKSYIIRNRITHPKKENDLLLTSDDMSVMLDGYKWVERCVLKALMRALKVMYVRTGIKPDPKYYEILEQFKLEKDDA